MNLIGSTIIIFMGLMLSVCYEFNMGDLDLSSFVLSKVSWLIIRNLYPQTSNAVDVQNWRNYFNKAKQSSPLTLNEQKQDMLSMFDIQQHTNNVITEDRHKLRVYVPHNTTKPAKGKPVFLWVHGGGFIFGDITTEEARCRDFSLQADVITVSIQYRLSPEHPYPS